MKKLIILLLCISIFVSSSYAGLPNIRIRTEEEEPLRIDKKYDRLMKIDRNRDRLSGIIIIGFATYFFYNGLEMMKRDATYEGGSLLLMLSSPLFFWGITLTF